MWPFTKKRKSEPESAWDGPWAVMQGERDGDLLFARVNQGAAALVGDPRLTQRVHVGVHLNNPHDNGMPSNEEGQELGEIEDALSAVLESDRRAILVAALTCAGVRELIFYADDATWAREACQQACDTIDSHKVGLHIEADPEWTSFQQLLAPACCG
jgi:hypothetical protein